MAQRKRKKIGKRRVRERETVRVMTDELDE